MIGQPVPTLLRSRIAATVGVGSSSNPVFELFFFFQFEIDFKL